MDLVIGFSAKLHIFDVIEQSQQVKNKIELNELERLH